MAYFTVEQAAVLAASTVRVATLVDLEIDYDPLYLWNGHGQRTFGGKLYTGCGDLGSIEGLEEARSAVSQQVTFTLSAADDAPANLLTAVLEASDRIQGRIAVVSLQLFDESWAALYAPIPIYFGLMMPPRVTRTAATETSGATRTMQLPTENLFFGRHRPPAGRYTDKEQQARFPGDRFSEYVPQLVNLSIVWPDY